MGKIKRLVIHININRWYSDPISIMSHKPWTSAHQLLVSSGNSFCCCLSSVFVFGCVFCICSIFCICAADVFLFACVLSICKSIFKLLGSQVHRIHPLLCWYNASWKRTTHSPSLQPCVICLTWLMDGCLALSLWLHSVTSFWTSSIFPCVQISLSD